MANERYEAVDGIFNEHVSYRRREKIRSMHASNNPSLDDTFRHNGQRVFFKSDGTPFTFYKNGRYNYTFRGRQDFNWVKKANEAESFINTKTNYRPMFTPDDVVLRYSDAHLAQMKAEEALKAQMEEPSQPVAEEERKVVRQEIEFDDTDPKLAQPKYEPELLNEIESKLINADTIDDEYQRQLRATQTIVDDFGGFEAYQYADEVIPAQDMFNHSKEGEPLTRRLQFDGESYYDHDDEGTRRNYKYGINADGEEVFYHMSDPNGRYQHIPETGKGKSYDFFTPAQVFGTTMSADGKHNNGLPFISDEESANTISRANLILTDAGEKRYQEASRIASELNYHKNIINGFLQNLKDAKEKESFEQIKLSAEVQKAFGLKTDTIGSMHAFTAFKSYVGDMREKGHATVNMFGSDMMDGRAFNGTMNAVYKQRNLLYNSPVYQEIKEWNSNRNTLMINRIDYANQTGEKLDNPDSIYTTDDEIARIQETERGLDNEYEDRHRLLQMQEEHDRQLANIERSLDEVDHSNEQAKKKIMNEVHRELFDSTGEEITQEEFDKRSSVWGGMNYEETLTAINEQRKEQGKEPIASFAPVDIEVKEKDISRDIESWRNYQQALESENQAFRLKGDRALYELDEVHDSGTVIANRLEAPVEALDVRLNFPEGFELNLEETNDSLNPKLTPEIELSPSQYATLNQNRSILIEQYTDAAKSEIRRGGLIPVDTAAMKMLDQMETVNLATITGEGKKKYPTAVANRRLVDVMGARAGWMLRSGMTQEVADSINGAMMRAVSDFAEEGKTLSLANGSFGEEFEDRFTKYLHQEYFDLTDRGGPSSNAVDGLIRDVGMTVNDAMKEVPGLSELANNDFDRYMLHVQSQTERVLREGAGSTIANEFPYYREALEPGRIADVLNNNKESIRVVSQDNYFAGRPANVSVTEDSALEKIDPQESGDSITETERSSNYADVPEESITNKRVEREISRLSRAEGQLKNLRSADDPEAINVNLARRYFGDKMVNQLLDEKRKNDTFTMPNNYDLLASYKTNRLDVWEDAMGYKGYSYEMMRAMNQYGQAGYGMLDQGFYQQAIQETLNPNITSVDRLKSYLELGKAIPEMNMNVRMNTNQLKQLGANMSDMVVDGDEYTLEVGRQGDVLARSTSTNLTFPIVDNPSQPIAFHSSGMAPDWNARVSRNVNIPNAIVEAPEGHLPFTMNDGERTIDDVGTEKTWIKQGDTLVKLGTKGGGRIPHDAYTVMDYHVDEDGFHNLVLQNSEGNQETIRNAAIQNLQQNITRNYKGFSGGEGANELLNDLILDDAREDINASTLNYNDMIREVNRLEGEGVDIGRQRAQERYQQLAEQQANGVQGPLTATDAKIIQNQNAINDEYYQPRIEPNYSDRQARAMEATSEFFGSEDAERRMSFLGKVQDMQQSGVINESEGRALVNGFNKAIRDKAAEVGALQRRAVPGLVDLGVLSGKGFGPMEGTPLTAMTNTFEQTKDSLWGIVDSMKPLTNPVNHARENIWKREAIGLLGEHLQAQGVIERATGSMDDMTRAVQAHHRNVGDMIVDDLTKPLIQGEHAEVMRATFDQAHANALAYVAPKLNERPDLSDSLARTTAMREQMQAEGLAAERMNFHVGSQYEGRNLPLSGEYAFRDADDLKMEIDSIDPTEDPDRHKALWKELYNRAQGSYDDVDDARKLLGWDSTPDQYVHPFPVGKSPAGTRYAEMNLGKGWDDDLNEINRIRLRPMNGDDTLSGKATEYYNMLRDGFMHNPAGELAQAGIENSDNAARESIVRGTRSADVSEYVDEYSWDRPAERNRPLSNLEVKTRNARDSILESLRSVTESGHGKTVGLIAAGIGAAFVARQWTRGDVVEERPAHDSSAAPDSGSHSAPPPPSAPPSGGRTYLTEDSGNGVAVQINARNRNGTSQEQIGEALQRGMNGQNASVTVHHQDDTSTISTQWLQDKFAELLGSGFAR